MSFTRALPVLVLSVTGAIAAPVQNGSPDPIFEKIPFERWLAAGEQAQIRWETRVDPARLSSAQRLRARVEIQVDGDEVTKRKGRGVLVMLIQFEDSAGRRYQTHKLFDLRGVQQPTNRINIVYSQDVYALPGDYRVAFALADSSTSEYSVGQRMMHVAPLKNDPLPAAWQDLPPIEIIGDEAAAAGKLNLPVEAHRPIQVQLLVNGSPSQVSPGFRTKPIPVSMTLNEILAAFRVLSQLRVTGGTYGAALLNLTKRKIIYEQEKLPELDWPKVESALTDADPNVVDARSLQNRGHSAQFFAEQVRHRIPPAEDTTEGPPRALIVLTPPTDFESGEDLHSVEGGLSRNDRIFYIRYHTTPPRDRTPVSEEVRYNRRMMQGPPAIAWDPYSEPVDALERTVKTLHPRVFDVYTPDDFRKTIRELMDEIAKM